MTIEIRVAINNLMSIKKLSCNVVKVTAIIFKGDVMKAMSQAFCKLLKKARLIFSLKKNSRMFTDCNLRHYDLSPIREIKTTLFCNPSSQF